jgi:NitT/TauT family transport system substrate-binding protein
MAREDSPFMWLIGRIIVAIVAFVAMMTLVAFPAGTGGPIEIRIGVLKRASAGPVFIADDRDYFTSRGLDPTLEFFRSARQVAMAAAAGTIDFGVAAITPGLFNLAGNGAVTIVAGQSRARPGYPRIGYFATAKAYDAGLRRPGDFVGHAVAITRLGSGFHYSLGLLAGKDHFVLSSIRLMPMRTLSRVAAALKDDRVDGALLPAWVAAPLAAAGEIRLLGWVGDETPWQSGAVFASHAMMQHRDAVTRFLAAYREATRDYHDKLLTSIEGGRARIDAKTGPLIAIICRHTGLKPPRILAGLAYIDANGMLDLREVAKELAWYQQNHFVDPGVTLGAIVDRSFGFVQ